MEALFNRPSRQMSEAELTVLLVQRMNEVLDMGAKVEEDYPQAENLHDVRMLMLMAADLLVKQGKDPQSEARLLAVAQRLLDSPAPLDKKAPADFVVTKATIAALDKDQTGKASELISDMVSRYAGTQGEVGGLVYGVILAGEQNLTALKDKYIGSLKSGHLDEPGVKQFLSTQGVSPYTGTPFEAELTRLDGAKLSLPYDMKGKVVLVDFWATWCGPCVQTIPELERLYEKYNSQGFEIVSISLDRNRSDLDRFLSNREMKWIQTYSGTPDDPTAMKYGVNAIPSLWLIGKDGKIITDNARMGAEALIVKALKSSASEAK